MASELFRKKSLKRIESPESLNDYVRITSPGVWVLIAAVLLILIGFIVWGIVGTVETKVSCDAVFENGISSCLIDSDEKIKEGMKVEIGEEEGSVSAVKYDGDTCTVEISADVVDGKYSVDIITETVSPISFAVN